MFSYRCPSCGRPSYSSANASTVGACPHCHEPLGTETEIGPAEPTPSRRWRRLAPVARDAEPRRASHR